MTVLNGFLLLIIASCIYLIVLPFVNMDIRVPASVLNKTGAETAIRTTESTNSSPIDYALIADQNLFHPERKIPPEKAAEKVVPRPEIVLYGTLISNEVSIAYLEDKKSPRTTPGRGKRQTAAEKGYNLNGYILQQIYPDSVVFVKGDDRMLIRLEDGEKRRDTEIGKTPLAAGVVAGPQSGTPTAAKSAPVPEAATPVVTGGTNANPPAFGLSGRRNAAQIQAQRRREAQMQTQQSQ